MDAAGVTNGFLEMNCATWYLKVHFSRSRYRALDPELIPMYRQAVSRRWLYAIHPAVGCHYFPPSLRLPSQPKSVTAHRPVPNYTAWWQRHMRVNSLPKAVTWKWTGPDSNSRTLLDRYTGIWFTSSPYMMRPALYKVKWWIEYLIR